jgi:NAD(P)-dependent dehydrogenase (short-subunit alcohol dehydrogenase family)
MIATSLAGAMLCLSVQAALSNTCKPHHFRPPFFIKTMGVCGFDPATLSFSGTPVEQAMCLMRGMDATRNLAPPMDHLPLALERRVGETAELPTRETLSTFLSKQDLEWDFAAYLWQPVSRAKNNDPDAPMARYFVIHDTSGPNYGHHAFPDDINDTSKINNLANFACADEWGKAHVVVNRAGAMILQHELAIPWRETKFEQAANFAGALKGLFLHVELIQPRRSAPGHSSRNDAQAPDPAFTTAQYDRLALLYVIASVRAERWLVPAFHAAIDAEIPNGHDDPMGFNIESFAASLEKLLEQLQGPEAMQGSILTTASIGAPVTGGTPSPQQTDASDGPPPAALPAAKHDGSRKPAPSSAMVTPEIPSDSADEKSRILKSERDTERETVNAAHCTSHLVKGHRRRVCEPDRAERRGRRAHAVRSVDRSVPHQSGRARRHGGDLYPRHARGSSRHGRA